MAEHKNTDFDRPGGYSMPKGATQGQRKAAKALLQADIRLYGDSVPPFITTKPGQSGAPARVNDLQPAFSASDPDTRLYFGDCRDVLANLPERGQVDLIFADPPFNWEVPYGGADGWKDGMPRAEYERFTFDWLDGCIDCLAPHGSIFVNIPDDTAAEACLHLKRRGLTMINWCIWHFRFGQHRDSSFIMSKVHVLYFAKLGQKKLTTEITEDTERAKKIARNGKPNAPSVNSVSSVVNPFDGDRIWNPHEILEISDRAAIYGDPRTMNKETGTKGMRVPMDVWYGKYWGRIQGNNKERRHNHHNQIPEIYLERVIKACSNVGGLVLDPFCGSGTTSTVARALCRRSITTEYSKVNAKSAWERIMNGMVQREDAGKPQSTAIFKNRRKRPATIATS